MLEFTLPRTDGEEFKISVPTELKEVKLYQKINFDVAFRDILVFLSETDEEGMPTWVGRRSYYLYLVARCISEFIGIDLNEILLCDVEDLVDENGVLLPLVVENHIELYKAEDAKVKEDHKEHVLVMLYEHIYVLLESYKFDGTVGEDFSYVHKGIKYTVPKKYRRAILGGAEDIEMEFEKINLITSVECLEVLRWAYNEKKAGNDKEGNITYTEIIKTVAVLSRKDGETFPLQNDEIQKLVDKRTHELADLSVQTALDVFFCLTASSKDSKTPLGISGFLKVFHLDLVQSQLNNN